MSPTNVGIFPASGGIGGGTVKHIFSRLSTKSLTLIARSPAKLEKERLAGATVRKADYDDTSSLEHAFDGVETLFLISYASVEHQYRSEVSSPFSPQGIGANVEQRSVTVSLSIAPSRAASGTSSMALLDSPALLTTRILLRTS